MKKKKLEEKATTQTPPNVSDQTRGIGLFSHKNAYKKQKKKKKKKKKKCRLLSWDPKLRRDKFRHPLPEKVRVNTGSSNGMPQMMPPNVSNAKAPHKENRQVYIGSRCKMGQGACGSDDCWLGLLIVKCSNGGPVQQIKQP